jgi:hypothetical protein
MTPDEAREKLMETIKGVKHFGMPVVYPHLLNHDFTAAAFLHQCIHWAQYADGEWVCKSYRDFEVMGFTRAQVDRCKVKLSVYIQFQRRGMPARTHYRIDYAKLYKDVAQLLEYLQLDAGLSATSCRNGRNKLQRSKHSVQRTLQQVADLSATAVNSTQVQTASPRFNSDSQIYVDSNQTPTARRAASLGTVVPSSKGEPSANSHIHISQEDLALLAQRHNIRFQRPPSDVAKVFIRNLLDLYGKDGERCEGLVEIVRAFAERTNGFGGDSSSAAAAERNTIGGAQP